MALATKHLKTTPPTLIGFRKREDAEKFWNYMRLWWDIGPAKQQNGEWLVEVPATLSVGFVMIKFLRDEFNISITKEYNAEFYCPACHQLYEACSCNVA